MELRPGTYVVTGAAGDIGSATVQALAKTGVRLIIADINLSALESTASRLREEGVDVVAAELDVSDAQQVADLAASLSGEEIRGLVNIAGIYRVGNIDTVSEEGWDQVLDINLKGTFLMCQAFIPLIEKSGGGSVVNISSLAGRTKSAASAVSYASSKAGVIGLTMSLAVQHAAAGVRVNNIAPGNISGAMYNAIPDAQRAASAAAVPLGRPADPSEVADPIVYLLSNQSSYITGQTINVNGGIYMA